ncbi:MAG: pilus assembly protein TadG-related protein [Actinomycetota bacterium]|nr:pilus assembly protein TadG-related protein [Actinomycetota bacterium]
MTVHIRANPAGEQGGVLVMVVLWLPILVVMLTVVVDVGNWFEHRRHLQLQADAAALAGAQEFRFPCDNSAIEAMAGTYGGDSYNAQIGATPASRMFREINSKTFHDQPTPADDTVESPPCSALMVDVKLTETDLPWLFAPVGFLVRAVAPKVDYINAHARVSVNQIDTSEGSLPIGVPDTNPKSARATFINESTGAVLGATDLTRVGSSNGLAVWDNAGAPLPVALASSDVDVGVVVALGGAAAATCGQPLVSCYDAGVATGTNSLPSRGILHIRGWSAAGSGAQPSNAPILRQAELLTGSCADPYFSSATASCTVGVRARVDFGTVAGVDQTTLVGAKLTARAGGQSYTMAYNSTTRVWESPLTLPVAAAAGPVPVTLDWAETIGTLTVGTKLETCSTSGGNKCKGSFDPVQRAFGARDDRSGPIKVATVSEDGLQWSNSLERCSSVQTSCTHNLVVRIGVKGSLENAASASDPVVELRLAGGSQNQSLNCDPAVNTNLSDELARGCSPTYSRNQGTACPTPDTLWASAQPWRCVALQTGGATNQVPRGLNQRILGNDKPTSCTAPNNWSQFPDLPNRDPRIVQVFLTPFGSFSGNGSSMTVPVTDFATFYVTGWTGQGQGFANPCQGNGDDPVPNNDAGIIVGHFIKYVQSLGQGTGTTSCDLTSFGSCVASMTR